MAQSAKAVKEPESAETQTPASPAEEQKTPVKPEVEQQSAQPKETETLAKKTQERMQGFKQKLDDKDQMIDDLSQQIQQLRTPTQSSDLDKFVDKEGRVDVTGLNKAFKDVVTKAQKAEQTVQGYIRNQQEREAYEAYPTLQPETEQFDKNLHNTTRALLYDSMMNPKDYQNRPLTFKEAADMANQMGSEEKAKVEKQAKEEAYQKVSQKEAASLGATGTSGRRTAIKSEEELSELRTQTQEGNIDAIAERLRNLPE